jgi:threonine/homoserine/homoserine lactone efflux protein
MSIFFKGLVLGLAIAAPVGPIGLLCIRRTLADGRLAGFLSGLGAATADACYGCIAAFGLTAAASLLAAWRPILRPAGGLFLAYLGFRTLFARPAEEAAPAMDRRGLWGAYLSTLGLTLTNPATILSFGAAFPALGLIGGGQGPLAAGTLVAGVFSGSALWWLALSLGVGLIRARLGPGWIIWVNRAAGAILVIFGIIVAIPR